MIYINGVAQGGDSATKEVFAMVYFAGGGDAAMEDLGIFINAASERGYAAILIPHDFTTLVSLEVILQPNETGANMHCDIRTCYGAYNGGEDYYVHNEVEEARDIGATVDNQNLAHNIDDLVDIAPLAAGDYLRVKVAYNVTAVDTNLYYKGLRLRYT